MDYLWESFVSALKLLISLDPEVVSAATVSLKVAFGSTILATLVGVPLGFVIGFHDFYGKRIIAVILNTLLSLPTVVVGLLVYSFISHRGPLGSLELLFTQTGMILGQFILITPLIAALTMGAINKMDRRIALTAATLGATGYQTMLTVFREHRSILMATIIAGFGRAFSEVGVAMMLGGNIRFYTRNLTTAIALETSRGEFALGIALGIILLAVAGIINIAFHWFQNKA